MIENAKKIIKQRTCIGCRTVRHKSELIRCVKSPDGKVSIDPSGKAAGRGAYVCKNLECLEKIKKKRLLSRALKTSVGDSLYSELEETLEKIGI